MRLGKKSKILAKFKKLYRLFRSPILIGFLIVGISVWMVATPNKFVNDFITSFDNFMYDARLKMKASSKNPQQKSTSPIIIVDIDERSLAEQGTWPWPRAKFAELVTKLRQEGVSTIAFSIVFSKTSEEVATNYLAKMKAQKSNQVELMQVLNRIIYLYEGDNLLADAVKDHDVVLGIMFNQFPTYSIGLIPPPQFELTKADLNDVLIPAFSGYSANFPSLQNSAQHAGFVLGIADQDGIIRHSPLLVTYKEGIYPSLALEATKIFLHLSQIKIHFVPIGKTLAVDKIILGDKIINTDASGAISIPYQGRAHFFQHVSATDVLKNRIPSEMLKGKLVFVGTSVGGLGDLHPTPIASVFPGVEIQANIAAALMGNTVPYTPSWSKGAEMGLIILIGCILSVILPYFRALPLTLMFLALMGILFFSYIWLWEVQGLIFSFSIPIIAVFVLVTMNFIYGFFFASRQREILFKTFLKYVPKEYAKQVSESPPHVEHMIETRVVTILFSDIRHFTDITEKSSVNDITNLLNRFFNPMTEIITKHQGTVDKYIGDMIMAFWGAPLEDPLQKSHTLDAALEMQKKAGELRVEFAKLNLPPIKIGIGINTGEVNLGEIGSEIRRSYTVIGDAVNLASRLESLTKYYLAKIIVGENTYADNANNYIFRHLDKVTVKGKQTPIEIYELICKKEDATPQLLAELEQYNKASAFYYSRQWLKAYEYFFALTQAYPSVKIYSIYLKRAEKFLITPPGEDWNGTFIRVGKY